MLDLFSGLGGASAAMKDRGWRVIRVDNEPRVKPDIVADVLALPFELFAVDLLWASPPCTYYSRYHKRFNLYPGEPEPDHALYEAARAIIAEWAPRYWVIENVHGAIPFWGRPDYLFGPYALWTNLPLLSRVTGPFRNKRNLSWGSDPLRSAKRGRIPHAISEAVAAAVEAFSQELQEVQ